MKKQTNFSPLLMIIALAALASIVIYYFTVFRTEKNAPAAAIRTYLAGISSYQSISQNRNDLLPDSKKSAKAEALGLFFDRFSLDILSQDQNQSSARVKVKISGIDTDALARDIRKAQYRSALTQMEPFLSSLGEAEASPDLWELICELLSENNYPLTEETGEITLTHRGTSLWLLADEAAVTKLVTGDLAGKLNDPYLLSPEEVLKIYLELCRNLTEDGWTRFLDLNSIFSSYGEEKQNLVRLYAEKIRAFYDFSLGSSSTKPPTSTIPVTISSIDLSKVLPVYREKLQAYGDSFESMTGGTGNLTVMSGSLFVEALNEAAQAGSRTISVRLENDGSIWQIANTDGLTDALLGGIAENLEHMNEDPGHAA